MRFSLYIGNKNYSSWSMRPWVLMRQKGIPFREVKLRFDAFAPDSDFKRSVLALNPAGLVPVLVDHDVGEDLVVWDTLAICEYLAEQFPALHLWPEASAVRARARSLSAEMHSGFGALRTHFPMNIEASLGDVGRRILEEKGPVRQDVARIVDMWSQCLRQHGEGMLFGDFTIADAFFAPVVMRFVTYAVPLPPPVQRYTERLCAMPGVAAWMTEARAEQDFRPFEEPYRSRAD